MENLYFVFEPFYDSQSLLTLKGVYTKAQYSNFLDGLADKAEHNVLEQINRFGRSLPEMPQKPNCPPDIEKLIKDLKKQSNKFRLAGDFDAFVAINARIRALNKLLKEKKKYEEAQQCYRRLKYNATKLEEKFEELVHKERKRLANNLVVIASKAEPRYDNYLTINMYRESPNNLEYVTFNTKRTINDYPSFQRMVRKFHENQERYEDKIRSARKHYNACRHVLDSCTDEHESMSYKKNFKRTVDAYYHLEKLNREYEEFNTRSAEQEIAMKDKFHSLCTTITVPVDTEYHGDVRFTQHEVRKFGTRMNVFIN